MSARTPVRYRGPVRPAGTLVVATSVLHVVITVLSVLTLALFLAVLFRRVTNPVMRMLSNFDDYFSWFITMLVLVTGLAATAHIGAPYQTLLALHILSFDALLVWFPFGKLMHAFYIFPSRAINGALLARKGATS